VVVVWRHAPCQRVLVRTILLALLVIGCKASHPHTPPNNTTSTSLQPDTEQVYKAKGKLRFINKSKPGGPATTGTLEGTAIDANKQPMIGMTVVVTSPALVGENGKFIINNLPPGTYRTTYYYENTSFGNPKVVIRAGMITIEDVVDFPINGRGATYLL
jgi:hypothetical protein